MQLAPVTPKPLPDDLLPKLAKLKDAAGVPLVRITFEADSTVVRTQMVAGQSVEGNRSPGGGAVQRPTIVPVTGSFEDAVRAAAGLSVRSPLTNAFFRGSQPVAVIQAADGAFGITPLLQQSGNWSMFASAESLNARYATQSFTRLHSAVQAVVSADQWVDMRTAKVGAAASA